MSYAPDLFPTPPLLPPETEPHDSLLTERVLVVDDDEDLLELNLVILTEAGLRVAGASCARECLAVVAKEPPDLILLDINLPDISGLELCRRLKADPATAGIAIVHLSGNRISSEEQASGLDAGADGYIARPLSNHELVARVETTLRVRRTEAALRQVTAELYNTTRTMRQMMEYSLDMICSLDAQGAFVEVSSAVEKLLGYSRAELIGRRHEEIVHPEDRARFETAARLVRSGHPTRHLQCRVLHRDGSISHFVWSAYWSAAKRTMFCVGRDTTDQYRQEEQLRESEERFRQFAENVEDAFWIVDAVTERFLYTNPAFQRMSGRPGVPIDPDAASHLATIHPLDRERFLYACQHGIDGFNEEYRVVWPDGSVHWNWARMFPIRDSRGGIYRLVGIARDITERKRSEALIAEQAALLDHASDAILTKGLDGRIHYWNKSAEQIFGWAAEEAVDRPVQELLYEDPSQHAAALRSVLKDGHWRGESAHRTRDGREVLVEGRWTLLRDDAGEPRSILAIATDITERKRLETQFLRAQRMESIGTLAGGIAHDLNNVLSPIVMSIELLKLRSEDPTTLNVLETIETSARRGAEMVKQVLSFARGVEGERLLIQPAHLLRDIEKIVADTFPKNLELRTHIKAGLWNIVGDPTQIHQVLLNLCLNARDAMPCGGKLVIETENVELDENYAAMNIEAHSGPHVTVTIRDDGMGMSRAVVEKIFDPFFTTKELGKGTGLGLSTSLAIVKSHGGFIRVSSEPGKGSNFTVHLPALVDARQAAPAEAAQILPVGAGELILVIDDEDPIRRIARQTLEAFGYRALCASDGAEAIALFAQHKGEIALVLTDMMMPIMDGAATIQVLTRMNPHVRIIAASGMNAPHEASPSTLAHVRHFLPKPYTAETLLRAIAECLRS